MISNFYSIDYDKEIGKGVSGQVYEGFRKADKEPVAVKIIFRRNLNRASMEAVGNEIKALRLLSHPNIVKLYDIYEDRHTFYLCMELLRGGELFDRITEKTFYSEKSARDICKTILFALKHCHDRNIVHRDLKPENLMMLNKTDDSQVKLVDFGFAAEVHGNSLRGQLGTPIYMAPEIWNGRAYGKAVDMWSFGVIVYILLVGYPPFSDNRRDKLIQKIISGNYVFHSEYWSNISEEGKEFVRALLNTDPEARLTVDQALRNKWLDTVPQLLEQRSLMNSIDMLKEFNAMRKLKVVVQAVIAAKKWKKLRKIGENEKPAAGQDRAEVELSALGIAATAAAPTAGTTTATTSSSTKLPFATSGTTATSQSTGSKWSIALPPPPPSSATIVHQDSLSPMWNNVLPPAVPRKSRADSKLVEAASKVKARRSTITILQETEELTNLIHQYSAQNGDGREASAAAVASALDDRPDGAAEAVAVQGPASAPPPVSSPSKESSEENASNELSMVNNLSTATTSSSSNNSNSNKEAEAKTNGDSATGGLRFPSSVYVIPPAGGGSSHSVLTPEKVIASLEKVNVTLQEQIATAEAALARLMIPSSRRVAASSVTADNTKTEAEQVSRLTVELSNYTQALAANNTLIETLKRG